MIDLSRFVEAKVMSIKFIEEGKEVQIDFQHIGDENFSLICTGVERFLANEIREHNVVDRAILWDSNSDQCKLKDNLRYLISGKSQTSVSDALCSLIENELLSIKVGNRFLFELEPVYGAWVLVLAKSFSFKNSRHSVD